MTNKKISGPIFVFFGALCWSLNAPLVKFVNLDPFLVAGLRSLIAGIVLIPFINIKKLNFNKWTLAYILSYAGLSIAVIFAISKTVATVAIGMQFSAVLWIFLINTIKKKKVSRTSLYAVAPIMFGIILFMLSSKSTGSLIGNLAALSSGLFFTGVTLFAGKARTKNNLGLISLSNLATGLIALAIQPSNMGQILKIDGQSFLVILILGVVQMALGYVFYLYGLDRTSEQKAAIISVWEMILGPLWVAIFFREIPNLMVFSGFLLILFGILLESYLNKENLAEI